LTVIIFITSILFKLHTEKPVHCSVTWQIFIITVDIVKISIKIFMT